MKKESEKVRKKEKYVHFKRVDDTIFEVIYFEGEPKFLSYSKDGKWEIVDKIEIGNTIFYPKDKTMIPYRPYVLEQKTWNQLQKGQLKTNKQELLTNVLEIIDAFLHLDTEYKILISVIILESYQQHKLESLGYLFILGTRDSGKSRLCELFSFLANRPLLSLDISPPNIFNYIGFEEENEGTVTIIEDEIDWKILTPNLREKLKIYRSGYRKGSTIPRILDGSKSVRNQKFYRTFCLKIFSGYFFPKDDALKSRCTPIQITKGTPEKDEFHAEDKDIFDSLKFKLLLYKMTTFFNELPEINIEFKGRMKEKWKGRILIASGTDAEKTILALARRELKDDIKEVQNSFESFVLRSVYELYDECEWIPLPFSHIWTKLMINLGIECGEAYDPGCYQVNDTLHNMKVTKQAVGRLLNSVLQGESKLERYENKPQRVWSFKKETLKKLLKARGLSYQKKFKDS